jgi:hypothetical protein
MAKSKKSSHQQLAAVAGLTAALLASSSALAQELALKRVMSTGPTCRSRSWAG